MGLWRRLLTFIGLGPLPNPPDLTDLTYRVYWSTQARTFEAEVLELPEVRGRGESPQAALNATRDAVRQDLVARERDARPLPTPARIRGLHTRINVYLAGPLTEDDVE